MTKSKETSEERAARHEALEEQQVQLRGKRQGRKWFKALALTIPFLVIIGVFAAVGIIVYSNSGRSVDLSKTRSAKAVLQEVVAAAQTAADDHNGSFASLTIDALKHADPAIKWVTGSPAAGEVGLIENGTATFKFVYENDSAAEFQVARDEQGVVSYTDSNGNPL
jgi:hypothetical protein